MTFTTGDISLILLVCSFGYNLFSWGYKKYNDVQKLLKGKEKKNVGNKWELINSLVPIYSKLLGKIMEVPEASAKNMLQKIVVNWAKQEGYEMKMPVCEFVDPPCPHGWCGPLEDQWGAAAPFPGPHNYYPSPPPTVSHASAYKEEMQPMPIPVSDDYCYLKPIVKKKSVSKKSDSEPKMFMSTTPISADGEEGFGDTDDDYPYQYKSVSHPTISI
ncbi:MAG: hypothetical protein Hyperionvirus9_44 [Hyperionvirus sp.]|uniref:Uncharacterized protein n=1 Tax=Hyperionvirus sp. TaxID=2487770 RepID=A0A3G5A8N9_9VIRU|nr:MAG: hypothetical protein Hyperionvirus9_44 [Hyperionvirus sp.]